MKSEINTIIFLIIITSIVNESNQLSSTNDFIIQVLNDVVYLNKTQTNLNSDCSNQLKKFLIDLGTVNQDAFTGSFIFLRYFKI
jgi:hypothetical protein